MAEIDQRATPQSFLISVNKGISKAESVTKFAVNVPSHKIGPRKLVKGTPFKINANRHESNFLLKE